MCFKRDCVILLELHVCVASWAGNFSLHHRVQTGSGVHPVSYTMTTRASFSGVKAAGAWSWPLTFQCRGQECVVLCFQSPIRIYGVVLS